MTEFEIPGLSNSPSRCDTIFIPISTLDNQSATTSKTDGVRKAPKRGHE